MADTSAWCMAEGEALRVPRGHADVATGLIAPAYGPDVS